ncbi:hypothetical protein AB0J74_06585 [Asanoa sp. NPDC049573]|uniref:hypothetical protein n=1 Tax=Asanoa sp. NPDC049573 TaxID=3155396 RepID=UPI00342061BA
MGTPDNGDSGPFDELPELPPDVRIPDDASELAEEAAQVRQQLREERVGGARSGRVFPSAGFRGSVPPDGDAAATEPASLRIPLLIMTAALLAAVISLFAAAWPDERRGAQPPASSVSASPAAATSGARRMVPVFDLIDERGSPVPLTSLLPAVLILRPDCPCAAEIAEAAPAGVTVVAIGNVPSPSPLPGPADATVRRLRDPDGVLDDFLAGAATPGTALSGAAPPGTALSSAATPGSALGGAATPGAVTGPIALVARSGEVTRVVDSATPLSAYGADLAFLPVR